MIYRALHYFFGVVMRWTTKRRYLSYFSKCHFKNSAVEGEKAWLEKWNVFDSYKTTPIYYRFFSHFIGKDINIVPEDLCHVCIEPHLNPARYTGYYSDKNTYDKLFPAGYFPKTLFRMWNGGGIMLNIN